VQDRETKLDTDFSTEYSQRSDDELLQLASQRRTLMPEAAAALDAELHRRNLTEADRIEHQRFVKREEQRAARRERASARRWRPSFLRADRLTWVDLLWTLAAVVLISFTYLALPGRDRMSADWQEAAFVVMLTSVGTAVVCRRLLWRKFTFWVSLLISSAIQLVLVHAFAQRLGHLDRSEGKGAILLGFLLFAAVYGSVRFLRRMLYGKEASGGVTLPAA
jgi:hypothetical protein